MKIGLFAPLGNPFATPEYIATLGREAEARGFHSLWVAEHVVLFDEYESKYPYAADGKIPAGGESGILEPFTALSFIAAVTDRIRLGTGICLVPQRNPVYTAKEVASIDWLSNGRFDFGIGVGWLREEFDACNVPFERRGERTREYIEVMRRLWEDPVSEHHGEFYDMPPLRQYPKPIQQPHPPIHFGGESDAALRRVADVGNGWYGFNRLPEEVPEALTRLDKFLAEAGRIRADIEVSICPYLKGGAADQAKQYEDAGVDQVIFLGLGFDLDGLKNTLDQLAAAL
ncbi:MAG: LLM class F420-dependent oxidoreductase [Actinobacteria bacterium]|nr:LLM class F420-dependent oxidoreductase [Actinomycetota bacterium]